MPETTHRDREASVIRRRFHRDRFCKGCAVRMEEVTIRHNGNDCYDELNAREEGTGLLLSSKSL